MGTLKQAGNVTLLQVVEDGLQQMKESGTDGFEYVVGEHNGMEIKVVCDRPTSGELICIDGVNGFGYTLLFEDND